MLSEISWSRWSLAILCGVALYFLYFFGLTRSGLLGPDEPRYAAIGQAIAHTGDWITPRLWGHAWFEKPALLYWMTAAGFKFGLGPDLAPRLPVAFASVACLLYFLLVLWREFGQRPALYATTILASSAGWLAYSHVAVPDLPMSAAFAAAMLTLMREGNSDRRRAALAGLLLGIAVLGKGLVPLVLFVPALWFLRRRILDAAVVLFVAAVVATPWYVLVTMRNGAAFIDQFFTKQQFARFLTGEFLHVRPFWFYVPVFVALLFPWCPLLLLLFSRRLFQDRRASFLLAWFAFGFVFFSLSKGKLPGYVIPLLPPIAALLGVALDQTHQRSAKIGWLLAGAVALLILVPTVQDVLPQALLSGMSSAQIHFSPVWLLPVLAACLSCLLLERSGHRVLAVALLASLTTLFVLRMIWQGYPVLDREVSARGRWISSAESITCVPEDSPSLRYGLDYYAGRDLPDCN